MIDRQNRHQKRAEQPSAALNRYVRKTELGDCDSGKRKDSAKDTAQREVSTSSRGQLHATSKVKQIAPVHEYPAAKHQPRLLDKLEPHT